MPAEGLGFGGFRPCPLGVSSDFTKLVAMAEVTQPEAKVILGRWAMMADAR